MEYFAPGSKGRLLFRRSSRCSIEVAASCLLFFDASTACAAGVEAHSAIWNQKRFQEEAESFDAALDLTYVKGLLALSAKAVTVQAIAQAEAVATKPGDQRKIQQAKDLMAEGDTLLAGGDYVGAVDNYQQAVRKVDAIR